ncbi:MAG: Ig-like domain-containing protein, partial [Anaerolineae bacterium]|nr:Ig-like domain-containing protein [Anaerolineae bacterium]
MPRFLILVLITLVAFSAPGLAAQQPDTTADLPFQVVDSSPLAGQELGATEAITVFFDRAVDCATAPGAVSLTPALDGAVTCDGASLTFTPSAPYPSATPVTLTISTALQAADGTPLAESLTLEMSTIGNLAVTEVLPDDGATGIETNSVITVIFNRPVVPLVSNEDRDTLPHPLTMDPAVDGKGEWLNTSIYVFRPDPALAGGTTYTMTVNVGLTAVDGAALADSYSWSFTTVDPSIVETTPQDLASDVTLDQSIQVTFNQPMDRASVESSFFIRPDDQDSGRIDGAFEWADTSTGFKFTPADNLALDTLYSAGFEPGVARGETGTATLAGRTDWSFVTVPEPSVVGTDPFMGEEDVDVSNGLTIYFASPMNQDTLKDHITIDPEPYREPNYYYYDWDSSYNISFGMEPSSDYTVTISPGMEDVYGNVITRERVVTFTTAPYSPNVSLQVPRGVGLYNAYNDQTQVFVTHRNVSRLDLELYSVPTDDFISRIEQDTYDPAYSYTPTTSQVLAQWTIQSATPENQVRYELLNLGAQAAGGGVSCPGAPASRLKVGDSAIVITDPDPLRARATPVDGEVVAQLYRDYRVSVVGGPVCADELLWWEVTLRDGSTGWVAEGTTDEYFLDLQAAGQTTPVDVTQGLGNEALAPGVYMLRVNSPETQHEGQDARKHFLMVSTASLTVKSSPHEVLIWATELRNGQPIPNAPITLYTRDQGQVASGVTDADGLVRLSVPTTPDEDPYETRVAVLQTRDHFGIGMPDWSDGIDTYQFGLMSDYPSQYRLYVYTDRPVYRPGQPVYFKGILRARDDVTYTPPTDFQTVPVMIYDESGEMVFDQDVSLTAYGTFSGEFDIADDAGLGFYRISVDLPTNRQYYYEGGGISFSVAEYRVPEFQVDVTAEADQVVQNEMIRVLVDSKYFFGGVVSDANVDYSVQASPYFFNYDGPGYYDFYDIDADAGPGEFYGFYSEQIASGSGTTDASGQYLIELPADLEDATQSQTWTIEATVRDESGLTVSGRTEVIVNKGLVYIGARPADYVGFAGQESEVEILAVDWDSQPVANQAIDVEVVERRWNSVQEKDDAGRTTWTWEVEEIPVTTGS